LTAFQSNKVNVKLASSSNGDSTGTIDDDIPSPLSRQQKEDIYDLNAEDTQGTGQNKKDTTGEESSSHVFQSNNTGSGSRGNSGYTTFLNLLIVDWHEKVVNYIDRKSQEAIKSQAVLDDPADFSHVRGAIIQRVLELLCECSDTTTVPSTSDFRSIVEILATKYPGMFGEDPVVEIDGKRVRKFYKRGTGGLSGTTGTFA